MLISQSSLTMLHKSLPKNTSGFSNIHLGTRWLPYSNKQGVPESVAGYVLGHTGQGLTFGLCGKAKEVDQMAAALALALKVT